MTQEQASRLFKCKRLWRRACEHDGIDPKESFVAFSDNNPFVREYEAAFREFRGEEAVPARSEVIRFASYPSTCLNESPG